MERGVLSYMMKRLCCFFLLFWPVAAHGFSCGFATMPTVCSEYRGATLVFRGRVMEVTPPPAAAPKEVTYPDGSKEQVYTADMVEMDKVRLEVLEVFKGDLAREITVSGSASVFRKGGEFLVFASPFEKNGMTAGACSRTEPIDGPWAENDLGWLRAYPNAPPTGSIFGKVQMGYGIRDIPAISIALSGGKTLTVPSAEDHSYAFKDLPPGTYTVSAVLPAGYIALGNGRTTVVMEAKGCAEVDWNLRHDSHIKGMVRDTSGGPAAKVAVGLLQPMRNRTGYQVVASVQTDANGNYDFPMVDPGDYWIALHYYGPNNNEPYMPAFYPSGGDRSFAELVHLGPAEMKENLNLVLPQALHSIHVRARVMNQDGTPSVQAHVVAKDPSAPTQAMVATADEKGYAEILLYAEREYSLIANTAGVREPACAGPVKFVAKEGLDLGTLTLDKTFARCRESQSAK